MVYDPRGGGSIHIDVALTQVSVGYDTEGLIADMLFPVLRVRKQSDLFYVHSTLAATLGLLALLPTRSLVLSFRPNRTLLRSIRFRSR
jgi:hypothetical protein